MNYPIFRNASPCGTLRVSREGLYTVFSAECDCAPGILRLWLGTFMLGVMQPKGDKLVLTRRLTKSEFAAVPPFEQAVLAEAAPIRSSYASVPAPAQPASSPVYGDVEPVSSPISVSAESTWQLRSDGTLISDTYIAIPSALRRHPAGVRTQFINGQEYILFRY